MFAMQSSAIDAFARQLQCLVQLLLCSRRKPTGFVAAAGDGDVANIKNDKSSKLGDIGDISTDDFSDDSGVTDGSTTDGVLTAARAARGTIGSVAQRSRAQALGLGHAPLAPPPGLEPPQGHSRGANVGLNIARLGQQPMKERMRAHRDQQNALPTSTSARPHMAAGRSHEPARAACASDPRQSISMLREALDEWESSLMATDDCDDVAALQGMFDKLSPQEATTLKAMLEQRASSHPLANINGPCGHSRQATAPPAAAPFKNTKIVANEINGALAAAAGIMRSAADASTTGGLRQDARLARRPYTLPQEARPRAPRDGANHAGRENAKNSVQGSMSAFLRDLSFIDNARVLMVRKISKLGFDSASKLQDYFSKFGVVERVMATATKQASKQANQRGSQQAKLRPATVGFVIMGQPEEAAAALNYASTHVVAGEEISVHRFQSHSIDGTD